MLLRGDLLPFAQLLHLGQWLHVGKNASFKLGGTSWSQVESPVWLALLKHRWMFGMKIIIRNIGNSKGVVLPKPLLEQVGLSSVAQLDVENDAIVLRRPTPGTRAGCAGRGAV
ncbi:MAG: hypothetical protein R3E70_15115 [Burkholderiaceae bacterium]